VCAVQPEKIKVPVQAHVGDQDKFFPEVVCSDVASNLHEAASALEEVSLSQESEIEEHGFQMQFHFPG
jgi:dienelactone hydrolase